MSQHTSLLVALSVVLAFGSGCELGVDREIASSASETDAFTPPTPASFDLGEGLRVWHLPSPGVPLVQLSFLIDAGSVLDPPEKAGLSALTFSMLDEGAGDLGALELADEIDYLGAVLGVSADRDFSSVSLRVLRRNLDPALDLMADVILRPRFEEKEWARVKTLWLNGLKQRRDEPTQVARVVADRTFYGDGHPYAMPLDGLPQSIEAIELEHAKEFYRRHILGRRATFLCVGDIATAELKKELLSRFGSWLAPGAAAEAAATPELSAAAGSGAARPRLVIVHKPDAPQTVVRIQIPAPPLFAPERAPLMLANTVFGGTFTSRLMANLREQNKFTYGARSALAPRFGPSYLVAQSSVYSHKTGAALLEFCREFRRMGGSEGPTAAELRKARALYRTAAVKALETQEGAVGFFAPAAAAGKDPDERRAFYQRVERQPAEAVASQVGETFVWSRALIVLVGDRDLIVRQLAETEDHPCALPQPLFRDADGSPIDS